MKKTKSFVFLIVLSFLFSCSKGSYTGEEELQTIVKITPVLGNNLLSFNLLRSTNGAGALSIVYAVQMFEENLPSCYGLFDDPSKIKLPLTIGGNYTIMVAAFPTFSGNGIKCEERDGVLTYFLPEAVILNNQFKTGNLLTEIRDSTQSFAILSYYKETTIKATAGMSNIDIQLTVCKIQGNADETPQRVYWDMATQPELIASNEFRIAGANRYFSPTELAEVEWGGPAINNVNYSCGNAMISTTLDVKNQYVYGDMMRFSFSPTTNSWFEWKLPTLNAGLYCTWLCWRRETDTTFRTLFKQEGKKDQELQNIFNLQDYYPTNGTVEENFANGWKIYPAKNGTGGVMNSKFLGILCVESSGRHTMRFENLTGRTGATSWDMIQFIPIDEDQLWPRIDILGSLIYPNTPDNQIWPFNVVVPSNFQGN